jgi:integrase/recombinase XerD
MGLGKQAKILRPAEVDRVLRYVETNSRAPLRDRLIVLLTHKAGMRACEVAALTWDRVLDASQEVGDMISLMDRGTKGKTGGREIAMHGLIRETLRGLLDQAGTVQGHEKVCQGLRGPLTADGIVNWFTRTYAACGLRGASSHSGRRTFATAAAKKCITAGGSLRDVQQLLGHRNLNTTQRYIEGDSEAKRKLISLL